MIYKRLEARVLHELHNRISKTFVHFRAKTCESESHGAVQSRVGGLRPSASGYHGIQPLDAAGYF